ncbi:Hsp20/alpha crystallin family protein [Thermoflexus sp.]|uniref:Hsp20/alpha crystallin family protein n=1 Tax=Thermoflexus sp. TaxID=1969742 RepID=UPI0035E400B4
MAGEIRRWDPFQEVFSLRRAIDRILDEAFSRPSLLFAGPLEWPAVDIYETKDEVVVKAAVPGVRPEDLEVTVSGNTVSIRGEFREEQEAREGSWIRQERRAGSFARSFVLPVEVVADRAVAEYEHGVLTLRLPKAEAVKARTIKVKVK